MNTGAPETKRESHLPQILTVEDNHDMLHIGTKVLPLRLAEQVVEQRILILWDMKGLYGLVSPGLLANALAAYRSLTEARQLYPRFIGGKNIAAILWYSTMPVPTLVAKLLKGDAHAQREMLFKQWLSSREEGQQAE